MKPFAGLLTGFRLSRAPLWASGRARRIVPALGRGGGAVLLLSLALRCAAVEPSPQEGIYSAALREYIARQDQVRSNEIYQLQLTSDRQRRNAFEAALTEHLQALVQPAQAPQPVQEDNRLIWAIIAALTMVLGLRVVAPPLMGYFVRRFDPWKVSAIGKALGLSSQQLAEDPAWTGFVRAMEEGLKAAPQEEARASGDEASSSEAGKSSKPGDPGHFFEVAPQRLASLRALFAEFSRPTEAPRQPQQVLELLRQVQAFKESASTPALLPVRQLTAALVGLLTQLSKQPANLTPSTLRTLAAALDLLKALCVRGVKPHLASEPPVRLLAVDDEPLTRGLVSRALQKIFSIPDMAPGGPDALALAAKHSYDLIFLDVEMPGMDGYELCQKLHQLPLNAATPVIFVTRHSDFQARAKSTLHGAQDLIAKPFLAFELALKALTLILRTRLNGGSPVLQAAPAPVAATPQASQTAPEPPPAPATPMAAAESSPPPAVPKAPRGQPETTAVPTTQKAAPWRSPTLGPLSTPRLSAASRPAPESTSAATEAAQALLAQAAAQFQSFRGQLDLLRGSARPEESNALLAKFYPSVASFCTEAYCAKLNAAFRLGSALEAMLKKLLEKPKLRPPSTLESVALALDVLVALAQSGQDPDLDQAPARLLVVDDDLLARRLMGEALQLAFGRPESADCGAAALAVAKEKPFDLIYLDVLMPGMDGFAACTEIHKTALNHSTPVMFVTSQSDLESRARATASGGSGFIAKPTLPCEITLVTVSLLLRHRLAEESQAEHSRQSGGGAASPWSGL
jgi:CheY-like chemotaxis protein